MKKLLSLFLAALMIFSVCGAVLASAADDEDTVYTILFLDEDGSLIATREVEYYGIVKAPQNPSKASTVNEDGKVVDWTFEGWVRADSEYTYHASTIPVATENVTYTAVYTPTVQADRMTVMTVIRSIFARINAIFEYFFRLFNREANKA